MLKKNNNFGSGSADGRRIIRDPEESPNTAGQGAL